MWAHSSLPPQAVTRPAQARGSVSENHATASTESRQLIEILVEPPHTSREMTNGATRREMTNGADGSGAVSRHSL